MCIPIAPEGANLNIWRSPSRKAGERDLKKAVDFKRDSLLCLWFSSIPWGEYDTKACLICASYSFEASLQVTLLLDGEVLWALPSRIASGSKQSIRTRIYDLLQNNRKDGASQRNGKLCQRDIRTQDVTRRPTSVQADLGIDHAFVEASFCVLLIPRTTEMCPAYSVNSPPAINPQLFICH